MPDLLVACLRDLAACAYHLKVLHRSADSMVNIYVYIYVYRYRYDYCNYNSL